MIAGYSILGGCSSKEADKRSINEALIMGTLWVQRSAEYRALAYQAFHIAKLRVDEDIKVVRSRRRAIVLDLDETVLNNSRYEAKAITDNQNYPDGWTEWCDMARADAIPGAREFLNYAVSAGCDVFYISNRKAVLLDCTLRNLKILGYPQVDEDHVLLRDRDFTKDYTKENRRRAVAKTHDIILLVGDNLNDFEDLFAHKSIDERFSAADSLREHFGRRFILLPNPLYGEWEKALYDYRSDIPLEERNQIRFRHLRSY
jgi:5'-nucleotidase (lipoprotein e(P4) family)